MSAVAAILDLIDAQREDVLARMGASAPVLLWRRPQANKWSPAEHLDHTRRLNACFRKLIAGYLRLPHPIARRWRGRPFEVAIDDVYERPNMPTNVGWLWRPQVSPEAPIPLDVLGDRVRREHQRLRTLYSRYDESYLGHVRVWDPAIGTLNLVQALRVGAHHDEHHYRIIRRQMDSR